MEEATRLAGRSQNPIKEDPELKSLFTNLGSISSIPAFDRWRKSFLDRFETFLDQDGSDQAEVAYQKFSKDVRRLKRLLLKLKHHMEQNELSDGCVTVKARQNLSNFASQLTTVNDELIALLPGTGQEEKERGYSKFNLAAILIRDRFAEYGHLKLTEQILQQLYEPLEGVADKQILEEMDYYQKKLGNFIGILADLGLFSCMSKYRELIPDEDKLEKDVTETKQSDAEVLEPKQPSIAKEIEDDDKGVLVFNDSKEVLIFNDSEASSLCEEEDAPRPFTSFHYDSPITNRSNLNKSNSSKVGFLFWDNDDDDDEDSPAPHSSETETEESSNSCESSEPVVSVRASINKDDSSVESPKQVKKQTHPDTTGDDKVASAKKHQPPEPKSRASGRIVRSVEGYNPEAGPSYEQREYAPVKRMNHTLASRHRPDAWHIVTKKRPPKREEESSDESSTDSDDHSHSVDAVKPDNIETIDDIDKKNSTEGQEERKVAPEIIEKGNRDQKDRFRSDVRKALQDFEAPRKPIENRTKLKKGIKNHIKKPNAKRTKPKKKDDNEASCMPTEEHAEPKKSQDEEATSMSNREEKESGNVDDEKEPNDKRNSVSDEGETGIANDDNRIKEAPKTLRSKKTPDDIEVPCKPIENCTGSKKNDNKQASSLPIEEHTEPKKSHDEEATSMSNREEEESGNVDDEKEPNDEANAVSDEEETGNRIKEAPKTPRSKKTPEEIEVPHKLVEKRTKTEKNDNKQAHKPTERCTQPKKNDDNEACCMPIEEHNEPKKEHKEKANSISDKETNKMGVVDDKKVDKKMPNDEGNAVSDKERTGVANGIINRIKKAAKAAPRSMRSTTVMDTPPHRPTDDRSRTNKSDEKNVELPGNGEENTISDKGETDDDNEKKDGKDEPNQERYAMPDEQAKVVVPNIRNKATTKAVPRPLRPSFMRRMLEKRTRPKKNDKQEEGEKFNKEETASMLAKEETGGVDEKKDNKKVPKKEQKKVVKEEKSITYDSTEKAPKEAPGSLRNNVETHRNAIKKCSTPKKNDRKIVKEHNNEEIAKIMCEEVKIDVDNRKDDKKNIEKTNDIEKTNEEGSDMPDKREKGIANDKNRIVEEPKMDTRSNQSTTNSDTTRKPIEKCINEGGSVTPDKPEKGIANDKNRIVEEPKADTRSTQSTTDNDATRKPIKMCNKAKDKKKAAEENAKSTKAICIDGSNQASSTTSPMQNKKMDDKFVSHPEKDFSTKTKKDKAEPVVLTEAKRQKCYMWYARLGQPNRETMKKRVAALPGSCDITPEEVDQLPWVGNGLMLSVKEMNKLFMKG